MAIAVPLGCAQMVRLLPIPGWNNYGECNVKGWRDVIAIACGDSHTVGLCADGTVVATECDDDSRCSVGDWRCNMTITKWADEDECSLGKWWDIIAIDCGYYHTVGTALGWYPLLRREGICMVSAT